MKERPILFSGPMVRAILAGKKTMTRRVMKGVPTFFHLDKPVMDWPLSKIYTDEHGRFWMNIQTDADDYLRQEIHCPYGVPGDRLWVRETWGLFDTEPKDGPELAHVFYRATEGEEHELRYQRWRPSIHMPRWASRINLTVTDVRVERLQEIRPCDVQKEGVDYRYSGTDPEGAPDWIGAFRELWDKLNAKRGVCKACKGHGVVPAWSGSLHDGSLAQDADDCPGCKGHDLSFSWGANPWVWVIEFERETK